MPSASSVINVLIVGDARKLVGALGKADKATGGLVGSAAKLAGGLFVADKAINTAFDFVQGGLNEFDRLGDAITRVDISLGVLGPNLQKTAGNFERLGQSKQDMLELEANFVGLGTAVGILQAPLQENAENAAATAAAIALLDDSDPTAVIDQIAKAANGNAKAMEALEISVNEADVRTLAYKQTNKSLNDTLSEGELATARMTLVLQALKPKLDAASTGTMDLEQHQKQLQAKLETFQAQLGEAVTPVLIDFFEGLEVVGNELGNVEKGLKDFGDSVTAMARTVAGPLGNLNDLLGGIGDFFGMNHKTTLSLNVQTNDRDLLAAVQREERRNSGPQGRD